MPRIKVPVCQGVRDISIPTCGTVHTKLPLHNAHDNLLPHSLHEIVIKHLNDFCFWSGDWVVSQSLVNLTILETSRHDAQVVNFRASHFQASAFSLGTLFPEWTCAHWRNPSVLMGTWDSSPDSELGRTPSLIKQPWWLNSLTAQDVGLP